MVKKVSIAMTRRLSADRYGIAEWFGSDISKLTPLQRQQFGQLAVRQDRERSLAESPSCPFQATLTPTARCNKLGGVCSLRKYKADGTFTPGGQVVTVCPSRFLQDLAPGKSLFRWISEKMLDIPDPTIVKETPFLRKTSGSRSSALNSEEMKSEAAQEIKKAGRIDWIVVNPHTITSNELDWCAIETQALYFSGARMRVEFDAYAKTPSKMLSPVGKRRPDYRSNGPKRLWPQLDVKVPVLRNWGKKVVVVVDRFFYGNMNTLTDPFPRARSDRERRDNADIAWFIVDYNEQLQLLPHEIIFTSLENSRIALNATEPLGKSEFIHNLKQVLGDKSRKNKVFKA